MKAIKFRDSGEYFADRFGILFDSGDVFNLSYDADMPNGCCIYAGNIKEDYSEYDFVSNSRNVMFQNLPEGTKRQIKFLERRDDE